MPYFSSLQNFIDSVTARLTKPKRGVGGSEGVVATDVLEAMKDVGRYADDAKVAAETVSASFIARSLNLNATVYIDADTGDDARTGQDLSANATGPVRTLDRAMELHSGKTHTLTIFLYGGTLNLTAQRYSIYCPKVRFFTNPGTSLVFKKRTALKDASNITVGEGNARLIFYSQAVVFKVFGTIIVEGHAGSTGAGDQGYYEVAQGAIGLGSIGDESYIQEPQGLTILQYNDITVGTNATLSVNGAGGTGRYGSVWAKYSRQKWVGTFSLAAGAVDGTGFWGDDTKPRLYHPTSSTDANVSNGELVISPTDNNLYWKQGGVIYKAVAVAF